MIEPEIGTVKFRGYCYEDEACAISDIVSENNNANVLPSSG